MEKLEPMTCTAEFGHLIVCLFLVAIIMGIGSLNAEDI
jgi:hypothetical protein